MKLRAVRTVAVLMPHQRITGRQKALRKAQCQQRAATARHLPPSSAPEHGGAELRGC